MNFRFESTVILLLILIAFALRFQQLGAHSLWYDELLEVDIAQGPISSIGPQLPRHAAMPLDYYLLHFWIKLGKQESWVRFPALVFGVLAVPLTYALARRLFNRRVGLLAALLLTMASFAVRYSQEARPYGMLLFFTLVAFLGLWQVYQTNRLRYWALVAIGLSGAALSHYFTLFLLLPVGLFVAIHQIYHLKQSRYWQHTACFALLLLLLTMIFAANGRLLVLYRLGYRFSEVVTQPETLTLPASEKPNRGSGPPLDAGFFVENVLSPLSSPIKNPSAMLLYNALFLIALLTLLRPQGNRRKAILLLTGWLLLPVILIYLFLLYRGTFFATRYILYTLPAYLILVAYGLDTLAKLIGRSLAYLTIPKPLALYSAVGLLLLPLLAGQLDPLITHYHADSREDWRAVGRLLHAQADDDDVVIAVNAEPAMNWYYPPAAVPFKTYLRNETLRQAISQHQRQWFVLSSYSFKRDKKLRDWLKRQQAVRIVIDRRVVVYFHQQDQSIDEMLAQVEQFSLPQKPLTYAILAAQFRQYGHVETSRRFYQRAVDLAETPAQKAAYQARLAGLPSNPTTIGK